MIKELAELITMIEALAFMGLVIYLANVMEKRKEDKKNGYVSSEEEM